MRLLLTGATGSLGTALITRLVATGSCEVIRCLSRHEALQARRREQHGSHPVLRWLVGDVRDRERIDTAMWGIDTVIHAAALKRVDAVAYDPMEAVKTNVLGTAVVLDAAIRAGATRVIVVSTDKAVEPVTAYGATKAVAEILAVQSNAIGHPRGTRIDVVRYGNVLGSRGSVIHAWRRAYARGEPILIRDPLSTRFWISLGDAADFVLACLDLGGAGQTYVPLLSAMGVVELAEAVVPGAAQRIIGLRDGEKRHEVLVSESEAARTVLTTIAGRRAVAIAAATRLWRTRPIEGEPWPVDQAYTSRDAPRLSGQAMARLLAQVPPEDGSEPVARTWAMTRTGEPHAGEHEDHHE